MSVVMREDSKAYAGDAVVRTSSQAAPAAPRVPWLMACVLALAALGGTAAIKGYQHSYAWAMGLDAWSPEFQTWWMSIFYTEIIVLPALAAVGVLALWFTRDRNIAQLPARIELGRFYAMFTVLTVGGIVMASIGGLLVEADAAWHQVVIRDTDFTPTHILLFYLGIPGAIFGLILGWMWVHTRLPYFSNRISLPLSMSIIGFGMAGPVVAFNEWGHTFFYAEELFAAPVHWGFVVAIFFLVFLGGFVLQCLTRIRQLTEKVKLSELEAAIKTR